MKAIGRTLRAIAEGSIPPSGNQGARALESTMMAYPAA